MTVERVEIFEAGCCYQKEAFSLAGGRWRRVRFPAICAVFRHPVVGTVLYDTGYDPRIGDEGGLFMSLYRRVMRVLSDDSTSVVSGLRKLGVRAEEVTLVVLSHFHPDHIGGARLFPNARFLCSRTGYEQACARPGRLGFRRELLPDDFDERCEWVEDRELLEDADEALKRFGAVYDLFGDGSVLSVLLDGHAPGQVGLFLRGEERSCFLVSDAAWSRRAIREDRLPSVLTRWIQDDWGTLKDTLACLHEANGMRPKWVFVPSHCEEALAEGGVSLNGR